MEIKYCDDVMGTSFFGDTLYTTVNDLVKKLDKEPEFIPDENEKVQCEWRLSYNDIPFTIYDWKEYRYFETNEKIEWHIGARNEDESELITKFLKEKLNGANN